MRRIILTSAFSCALAFGCGGDDGAESTANPTGASTDGDTSTTNATTDGTTAGTDATGSGTDSDSGQTTNNPTTSGDPTTTATTDPNTTDTGCEFVCETDMPSGTIECDVWTQDCDEGEKCIAWANDGGNSWNSTKCSMVMGAGLHGDSCTAPMGGVGGEDTCDVGHMCWNIDGETGEGTCIELCTGSPEAPNCAPPMTTCVIVNDGVLNLCLPGCDPLVQDCQGNNEICVPDPMGDGFVCVLDASGDMHPSGTPCEFANQCNGGNICLNLDFYPHPDCQGSLGCCGPLCEFPGGQCPGEPAGLSCESWYEEGMAPPGYEDVGICIVAQ